MAGDPRYFYIYYMDDVIVLAKTRWHLRKAVKIVNRYFNQLKIKKCRISPLLAEYQQD
jgi:RNA-directed DNA polymerase